MWMWPLDSAMRATAAHRAPKRMADGTCTWGWAWMTDKCRRRMNRREGYITTKISQRGGRWGRGGRPRNRKEAPAWLRGVGAFPSSSEGSLLPGTLGRPILCAFHPQNKSSPHQNLTFGPTLYKFIVIGSVQKPWPYNYLYGNIDVKIVFIIIRSIYCRENIAKENDFIGTVYLFFFLSFFLKKKN